MQTPSWGFSSASESGADAANQPRSKSVEVVEGSSTRKHLALQHEEQSTRPTRSKSVEVKEEPKKRISSDLQHEEQATMQTRSKSTAVKEGSKKRKSLEPQRDDEAAKRPKPDEQHSKEAPKTQTSLFGPQTTPHIAGKKVAVLHDSKETEAGDREEAITEKDKSAGDDSNHDGQNAARDSTIGDHAAQGRHGEEATSKSRESVSRDAQDRADSEVIMVSQPKQTKASALQQQENSPREKGSAGQQIGDQTDGPLSDSEWEAKYNDLRDRANDRVKERNAQNKELNETVERLRRERDDWFAHSREVEAELKQLKAANKETLKNMRKDLKSFMEADKKEDLAKIKAQHKRDLDLKQKKHEYSRY